MAFGYCWGAVDGEIFAVAGAARRKRKRIANGTGSEESLVGCIFADSKGIRGGERMLFVVAISGECLF